MTTIAALELFKRKCDELGQAQVAADLEKSPSAINQLYHDKYKASPDTILQRAIEVYGGLSVTCPLRGEISLATCATDRRKPFESVTNPAAARLYRACRTCRHNQGGK
jgi:hypothetical protein